MKNQPVVTSRQPIEGLSLDANEGTLPLLEKFDMFREITTKKMNDAVIFAYLEHLLRISTELEVSKKAILALPKPLQNKILTILSSRQEILQGCLHSLDTSIVLEDISNVSPVVLNVNYRWDGSRLASQEFADVEADKLPVCYTLTIKERDQERYFLLYTPNMSYLDGYDPFTGATRIPLITLDMIKILAKEMYLKNPSKAVQTEGFVRKPEKKKKKIGEKKGRVPNIVLSMIRSGNPESEEVKKAEEVFAGIAEESKVENEEVEVEVESKKGSESESEHKTESDSEVEENPQPKQPGERTWATFQKRATELQKEREQCMSCIIN